MAPEDGRPGGATGAGRAFATIRRAPGSGRHRGWRVTVYDPEAPGPLRAERA